MSNMEAHTGRLVEIEMFTHMTIETYLKHIFMSERGIKDLAGWGNWSEYAVGESNEYFIHNDTLYKIKEHRNLRDEDVGVATRNKKGDIEFAVQFYNGGCCLEEALETVLDNLEKEENKQ